MQKKKKIGIVGILAGMVMVVCLVNIGYSLFGNPKETINLYSDYVTSTKEETYTSIRNNDVASAMVVDGELYYELTNGTKLKTTYDDSMSVLKLNGILVESSEANATTISPITAIALIMAIVSLVAVFLFFKSIFTASKKISQAIDGAGGQVVGKADKGVIQKSRPDVTFDDVQGIDGIKDECKTVVDYLKHPQPYIEIGAKPKKGVMLCGAPGTGKTLLAKAIAGEAGVPFLSISGSDFIEKYVGVGASRVRSIYAEAKKNAPCIVFIDEIDAIGGKRGEEQNSERDQTINALLTELDGFSGTEGVLTIAATNRLDMLDAALTRPGRFDLTLTVNLPDKEGRYKILQRHSKGKKLSMEVDLWSIAKRTVSFSGAALEALMNEAAHVAVGNKRKFITNEDVDDAFFKIVMKGSKKKRDLTDAKLAKLNKIVAYHEGGHALVTKLITNDSVPTTTIVGSTSGALGVTMLGDDEDNLPSKKDMLHKIMIDYGGRAAEELLFGNYDDITVGASSDIKSATNRIRSYIGYYGMGNHGLLNLESFKTDKDILDEAIELSKKVYQDTVTLLKANRETLDRIAQALLEQETIDEDTLDSIIEGVKVDGELCEKSVGVGA